MHFLNSSSTAVVPNLFCSKTPLQSLATPLSLYQNYIKKKSNEVKLQTYLEKEEKRTELCKNLITAFFELQGALKIFL